jgi:hypothetical protein
MPFCENCGNEVSETSKFCAKCGLQLKLSENTAIPNLDSSHESVINNPNTAISSVADSSILSDNIDNEQSEEKIEVKKKKPFYKSFIFWFWIVMGIFYFTCRIGWWGETMSGEGGRRLFIRIFVGVNALYFASKLRGVSNKNQ